MRNLILAALLIGSLMACISQTNAPQSFDDVLVITDTADTSICSLPLAELRQNVTPEALAAQMASAFDLDSVAELYKTDFPMQISVILRRAALKRRFNVETDNTETADKYYAEFDDGIPNPQTMTEYHTKLHYWSDRLAEQSGHNDPDSDDFNLRFCVLNEARAKLHADSRHFLLSKISDGSLMPEADAIENVNHETFYGDDFKAYVMGYLFSDENVKELSSLEMAMIRREMSILPSDPKTAEAFWAARDAEIEAVVSHVSKHNYGKAATKLADMRMIDQSLRRLWSTDESDKHFENETEIKVFKKGISQRVMKVDSFNTAEIKTMLKGRGWFRDDNDGEGASDRGWIIAQHADRDPEFQQEALKLIEAELGAPGVSKSNYAYLYDRVQMRFNDYDSIEKRLQRYGTQGRCTGPGTWEPLPMEDPDNIDARRAEVGLGPIKDYKARFKSICKEDQR